jgi:hypothetical protein
MPLEDPSVATAHDGGAVEGPVDQREVLVGTDPVEGVQAGATVHHEHLDPFVFEIEGLHLSLRDVVDAADPGERHALRPLRPRTRHQHAGDITASPQRPRPGDSTRTGAPAGRPATAAQVIDDRNPEARMASVVPLRRRRTRSRLGGASADRRATSVVDLGQSR